MSSRAPRDARRATQTYVVRLTASAAIATLAEGKRAFREDTFGDEQYWTDTLHANEVIEKAVDPTTALKVGLKVDADVVAHYDRVRKLGLTTARKHDLVEYLKSL